jgi:poly(3-hydroxybutyrate) depolymerase
MYKFDIMKKYLLLLIGLTLLSCGGSDDNSSPNEIINEADSYFQTIEINGSQREYIVYVPNSVEGVANVPILFMFHGTTSL